MHWTAQFFLLISTILMFTPLMYTKIPDNKVRSELNKLKRIKTDLHKFHKLGLDVKESTNMRAKSAPGKITKSQQESVGIMKNERIKTMEPTKKRVMIKSDGSIGGKEEMKKLLQKSISKSENDQTQLADDLMLEEEEEERGGGKEKTWIQRLRELKSNKGALRDFQFESRMAIEMGKAIEEFKKFLENSQYSYNQFVLHRKTIIPEEFDVPDWNAETCKRIQSQFNKLIQGGRKGANEKERRRKKAEEEELVKELGQMLAWPHELEAMRDKGKKEVTIFREEMAKPYRNEVKVSTKLVVNAALQNLAIFREKANIYIEKMLGLVRLYPVDFYTIDQELNETNVAIEEMIKNSVEMFRQLSHEHLNKRRALIRVNIEAKVPELTRCSWVILVWGETKQLEKDIKEELKNCKEDKNFYVRNFWNIPSVDDWKLYFPKEKIKPPKILAQPAEMEKFKDDMLDKFSQFRLYGFIEASVEGENFFDKFYCDDKKLEQLKGILAKLKKLRSIHWVRIKKGRQKRSKLKNQIKTLEILVKFGQQLNGAVKKMSDDILAHMKAIGEKRKNNPNAQIYDRIGRRITQDLVVKHGKWKNKKIAEQRIVDNIHLLILQWAPMYMELRLLLELNKRTKELFLVIRQLSLVSDEKLKAIPKFDEKELSKNIKGQMKMDDVNENLGILELLSKQEENWRKKIKEQKEKARMAILHEKFLAFHKAHSRVGILLGCLGLEEVKLKEKMEEKRRRTIVEKNGRKITRAITRISEYFAGRFRAITYEKYKAAQLYEGAERRMRDLVGKVLIVEMKIAQQWNGQKKETKGEDNDYDNEMREEDLDGDEDENKPRKKLAVCHAGLEKDMTKEEIIIKLLNEMFYMHLDVKKKFK